MDFKSLIIIDKLRPLFEKMGIDYPVMRNILYIKLLMDGRKLPTVLSNNKKYKENDNSSNMFIKSLWMYVLMGIILIPFIILKDNYIFQMSIVFAIVMFFLMTSLISDFSSVLLDLRDKNIIGTKPVEPKTLRMAKTIHILIYMIFLTAALVGPALMVSLFTQGPVFFAVFLASLVLLNFFVIILTSFIYFVVLRFFDGEKLKDIINYVQIILSIVIMVGYQLVGRLFNVIDMKVEFAPRWWQFLLPPVWFSAPFQIIKKQEVNQTFLLFIALEIFIPLLAMVLYVKLMPAFEKYLQKLGNNSSKRKKSKGKQELFIARLICRTREERNFYRFTADMMRNEREFKLKVYPSLGFSLVIPFIIMFRAFIGTGVSEFRQGSMYYLIYFSGMILPSIVLMMRYSESYKAAWIYKAMPVNSLVPVYKGTMKAFLSKLFFPAFLLEAVCFTVFFGVRIIPDLCVVFINLMIFNILCFVTMEKALPFSKSFSAMQQPDSLMVILLFVGLAVMAGIHYALSKIDYGIYINLLVSIIINLILWKVSFRISPDKLQD